MNAPGGHGFYLVLLISTMRNRSLPSLTTARDKADDGGRVHKVGLSFHL